MNKPIILIIAFLAGTQSLVSDVFLYRQYEECVIIDQEEEIPTPTKSWQKIQVTDLSDQAPISYRTDTPEQHGMGKEIS